MGNISCSLHCLLSLAWLFALPCLTVCSPLLHCLLSLASLFALPCFTVCSPLLHCLLSLASLFALPSLSSKTSILILLHERCFPAGYILVSHAAVICLVTQPSSPLTAAQTWTTFLSHCFCGKFSKPIMYQQNENDVSFRAKRDRQFPVHMCQTSSLSTEKCKIGVAGLHDSYHMFIMPFAPSICFERVFYI